ncbi:MAG: ATP-dependent helicase [Ardenticatenales bacterium]|nr:ATP-dependent helicase [Ardenticatenales bacterium]
MDTPVLRVEAGPGTGKTFGLIRRVQRIVHPDGLNVSGSDVLVVAFNRVIARELKSTIAKRLESLSERELPEVRTVHSLCLHILGDSIRLIMDHERTLLLYDIRELYPELVSLYGKHNKMAQALRDHEAGHRQHPQLWQAAQRWMVRHNCLSISEVPSLVRDHLQGGDLTAIRYLHVIIDEFQDLTEIERDLLLRLIHASGSLVVLGDTRQSIYAFRGNVRGGFEALETHQFVAGKPIAEFPNYTNRRCPREIVEAANNLMSLSESHPMIAECKTTASLHIVTWATPFAEARGMAEKVRDSVRRYPGDRHLVLVTRRALGFMLQEAICSLDASIVVHVVFSESILERWPAREAFLLFCLIADPDPATWRAWFGYQVPREGDSKSTFRVPNRNAAAYLRFFGQVGDRITDQSVRNLASEPRSQVRGGGGAKVWDRAHRYVSLMDSIGDPTSSPQTIINTVFGPDWWSDKQVLTGDDRRDLESLKNAALGLLVDMGSDDEPQRDLAQQLGQVARHLRQQIATREPFVSAEHVDVPVYTLWGSKGLTAEHVYIIGACDEAIPGAYDESYPGTENDYIEEQQRLMYVSITRSRRSLVISRPLKARYGDAKKLGFAVRHNEGRWVQLQMSRFMRSILRWLPNAVEGDSWRGID